MCGFQKVYSSRISYWVEISFTDRDSLCVFEWTGTGPGNMGFTRRFATRVGDDSHPLQEGRLHHLRIVETLSIWRWAQPSECSFILFLVT